MPEFEPAGFAEHQDRAAGGGSHRAGCGHMIEQSAPAAGDLGTRSSVPAREGDRVRLRFRGYDRRRRISPAARATNIGGRYRRQALGAPGLRGAADRAERGRGDRAWT
ncbi:MAG: hypothetical protein MZV65_17410 [Chromatiales bacterium]|nr:hypothetical protein [Chromatiales bacterium]